MIKYFILILVCTFFSLQKVTAQNDSLDCETKYQQWEQFLNKNEGITFMEKAPELIGGLESLQKKLIYPESGNQIDVEGRVYIQLIVSTNGIPRCIRVVKGLQKVFDQSAVEAVRKVKFKPATVQGKPLEVPYLLPVEFKVKNLY